MSCSAIAASCCMRMREPLGPGAKLSVRHTLVSRGSLATWSQVALIAL